MTRALVLALTALTFGCFGDESLEEPAEPDWDMINLWAPAIQILPDSQGGGYEVPLPFHDRVILEEIELFMTSVKEETDRTSFRPGLVMSDGTQVAPAGIYSAEPNAPKLLKAMLLEVEAFRARSEAPWSPPSDLLPYQEYTGTYLDPDLSLFLTMSELLPIAQIDGEYYEYLLSTDTETILVHKRSGIVFLEIRWEDEGRPRAWIGSTTVRPAHFWRVTGEDLGLEGGSIPYGNNLQFFQSTPFLPTSRDILDDIRAGGTLRGGVAPIEGLNTLRAIQDLSGDSGILRPMLNLRVGPITATDLLTASDLIVLGTISAVHDYTDSNSGIAYDLDVDKALHGSHGGATVNFISPGRFGYAQYSLGESVLVFLQHHPGTSITAEAFGLSSLPATFIPTRLPNQQVICYIRDGRVQGPLGNQSLQEYLSLLSESASH